MQGPFEFRGSGQQWLGLGDLRASKDQLCLRFQGKVVLAWICDAERARQQLHFFWL